MKSNQKRNNSKHQNNFRRGNRNNGRGDKNCTPNEGDKSPTNDVAWYATTPELLKDASSVPFSYPTGVNLMPTKVFSFMNVDAVTGPYSSPGIMTLGLVPCPGDQGSLASPINVAATAMYSFVRHANSGSANYNAPDLMMYAISMGQIYSYLNFLIRVYGCVNLYSHQNRYIPRILCNAQGVDFDSIYQHLADFRYGVNALIHKAASLACPADMTYFKRLAFLFSGIYAEGETAKDQLYMYIPEGFMYFSETGMSTGGSLQYKDFRDPSNLRDYSFLITYGNSLLNPILQSEDMNIMSGDILKAYGVDKILKLGTLDENYIVVPTTDLTVLEQMQNATVTDTRLQYTYSITQDPNTNAISCNVQATVPDGMGLLAVAHEATCARRPLTTILTNPEAGDVMERTRLMHTCDAYTEGTDNKVSIYATSEVAVEFDFWTTTAVAGVGTQIFKPEGVRNFVLQDQLIAEMASASDWSAASFDILMNIIYSHCVMENFKFHPLVNYFLVKNGNTAYLRQTAFDLDNYTMIDSTTLERINEAAALALFNVPSIAKF